MIPFFELHEITLVGITLQGWGIMVSLGFMVSLLVASKLARRLSLSWDTLLQGYTWAAVTGLIGARLVHCFFYNPAYFIAHPLEVLMIWQGGFSSLGGLVGGALGLMWIMRSQPRRHDIIDTMALSWLPGWMVGRIGCFFIHDHVGIASTGLLAVAFPGGARYDMALLEILALIPLAIVISYMVRSGVHAAYARIITLYYAVIRLYLDAFRVWGAYPADTRLLDLTPAQWASILYIIGTIIALLYVTYNTHRGHVCARNQSS